ncbi:MAG: lytic transglycosylase domain-containing protein [Paracoccaceae bacterium]
MRKRIGIVALAALSATAVAGAYRLVGPAEFAAPVALASAAMPAAGIDRLAAVPAPLAAAPADDPAPQAHVVARLVPAAFVSPPVVELAAPDPHSLVTPARLSGPVPLVETLSTATAPRVGAIRPLPARPLGARTWDEAVPTPVAMALPDVRPTSRGDLVARRLGAVTPLARPVHMVRVPPIIGTDPSVRPVMRTVFIPDARWDHVPGGESWTRATLAALRAHGRVLEEQVPRDIDAWCPGYRTAPAPVRRAFWVGLMSSLAKHESTFRPHVAGDNGRSLGLMQIRPGTADFFGCTARTRAALFDPEANLACAVRIWARVVVRDDAIALREGRWRGVAADWGPMMRQHQRDEIRGWVRSQDYCELRTDVRTSLRPQARDESNPLLGVRLLEPLLISDEG